MPYTLTDEICGFSSLGCISNFEINLFINKLGGVSRKAPSGKTTADA
ncbi:hypothetical protein URH17368_1952 [Alicyclobacillus hesperidum URH17-3-68]|nr:hypothetical protein URH17368_1952 [Alicyclobacillus hesperidum URH17-3-68]